VNPGAVRRRAHAAGRRGGDDDVLHASLDLLTTTTLPISAAVRLHLLKPLSEELAVARST
jgi:hypothetical protein